MPDREKVMKGLECAVDIIECKSCDECVYKNYFRGYGDVMRAALDLLKEQEAKTGHWVSVEDAGIVAMNDDGCPERGCFCSECKKYLVASDEYMVYGRYCPFCGAKMEGRYGQEV